MSQDDRANRTYGRRSGHKLRPGRQHLVETLLPRLRVTIPRAGMLDPASLFSPVPTAVWMEVGFGGGEHLARQAEDHPDIGLIGCEPFINGVARLLTHVEESSLSNVRILDGDARDLLDVLPDASIDRLFILFPDPWPKARHHKRRLIGPGTLDLLARVLADNAELRFASDHMDYVRWALWHLLDDGRFEWLARRPGDWRVRPDGWPPTRYEEKAASKGEACVYLRFRRRAR